MLNVKDIRLTPAQMSLLKRLAKRDGMTFEDELRGLCEFVRRMERAGTFKSFVCLSEIEERARQGIAAIVSAAK